MKNIVLASIAVITLSLTGLSAADGFSNTSASAKLTKDQPNRMPIPVCPPDDPNACGF